MVVRRVLNPLRRNPCEYTAQMYDVTRVTKMRYILTIEQFLMRKYFKEKVRVQQNTCYGHTVKTLHRDEINDLRIYQQRITLKVSACLAFERSRR